MMTHLSLFSGIGGLDLAAEMAGFETVGQCEWADYPRLILEKHWPGLPRWRDIRELTKEDFYAKTGMGTVDVISGGFPCQPHSLAGKKLAEKDERHLWPEFMRVVEELRPRAVVGENVAGILSTIHGSVCTDLEKAGYKVWTFCIPAYAVGAHHERYRVAIIGISESLAGRETDSEKIGGGKTSWLSAGREHWRNMPGMYWAVHQPPIFGMVDGVPGGVDGRWRHKEQMKALGNSVVPPMWVPIFRAIMMAETEAEP